MRLVREVIGRISAKVRGKGRLARAVLGREITTRDVLLPTRDGSFVVPNLDGPTAFHLLLDGVYEPEEIDLVLDRLPMGGVFADVGANIGVYSVPAARKVGHAGRVLAFEASPRINRYLEQNLERNGVTNVTVLRFAVGDANARAVPFYDAPTENFGMGTMTNLFGTDPVMVPSSTMDRLCSDAGVTHVDVMKVDVEGHEAGVFAGASNLLTSKAPPLILFEFNDWAEEKAPGRRVGDAQRVLKELGFDIYTLTDFLTGRPPLVDVLTSGFHSLVARSRSRS